MPLSHKPVKLTKEAARRLTLNHQLLWGKRSLKGKKGTLSVIQKLGYIQIDTINVIERAHHLTLHSRVADYKKEFIHDLQANDKNIFEYWAHAASFVPLGDYRYYLSYMEKQKHPKRDSWLEKWTRKYGTMIKEVRQRIKTEGALSASDFKDVPGRKRGPWWDWKPAKAALEILFWQGELMVKERRNFQRVYDLTERVLPDGIDRSRPTEDEEKQFFIKRALDAFGLASAQDINRYIGTSGKLNTKIQEMLDTHEIVPVNVDQSRRKYLMLASTRKPAKSTKPPVVRLLSPFDNGIILRDRIEDLFDFSYSLECYMPEKKRKYGYFCLPILWGSRFVGRIDPKSDKKSNILYINNLHFENKKLLHKDFLTSFSKELSRLASFNGCTNVSFTNAVPSTIRTALKHYF